jgi:hypothetical protein
MTPSASSRPLFVIALAVSAVAGFVPWGSSAAQPVEQDLMMLLRFMAAVKGLMALGLAAPMVWRVGHPVQPRFSVGYLFSGVLMCSSPGVIWQLQHVAVGALLFHGGLVLLVALAVLDDGVREQLANRVAALKTRRSAPMKSPQSAPTSADGVVSPTV